LAALVNGFFFIGNRIIFLVSFSSFSSYSFFFLSSYTIYTVQESKKLREG